jgi:feruloyl esterase
VVPKQFECEEKSMTHREIVLIACLPAMAAAAEQCERLAELKLPNTTITAARRIPAGTKPEASFPQSPPQSPGSALCWVKAVIQPALDSEIQIEVWMPEQGWNGKFVGLGNGGWAGRISQPGNNDLILSQGYAMASTDTGHQGAGATFAVGHPQKLIDYSYRAVHEMTVKAKAVIARYYGKGPRFSYWTGCSLGGQQALKEAQMYPADYDGISVGCPTYDRTHLHAWQLYVGKEALTGDRAGSLPQDKYDTLHRAVLEACDAPDGVKDGILNDPRQCQFDPGMLRCRGGDGPHCLTGGQVEMVRKMYAPAVGSGTGTMLYPGAAYGSEMSWRALIGGPEPFGLAVDMFKYLVHQDPNWDWRTFELTRETQAADRQHKNTLNAENADLRTFHTRGGKMLLWHGWSDAMVPPQATIDYYERVVAMARGKAPDFVRLFLVPGMFHCQGGPGPNQFNKIATLERWVESGVAPDQIIAYHVTDNRVDMTRPLCPYPQVAQWKAIGSTNDAANFACRAPD